VADKALADNVLFADEATAAVLLLLKRVARCVCGGEAW
jgi:hypothetical protein